MKDIADKATLLSGHTRDELKEMIDNQTYEPQPQIYSVKTVAVPEPPNVVFTTVPHTHHFSPKEVRKNIIDWFEHFHPTPNLNRGRLSGTAASLTFGAQTGRGFHRNCVIKRTLDYNYYPLITLVHELAQNAAGSMLPYLGFQILRLGSGQNLKQQRDHHNHADYPNHTMKFGKHTGGSLQMLRDGQWHSYNTECQWMSFDALKVAPRVTPVGKGARYSITLYTPGKLDRLTAQDWDNLARYGFPIYLYEPLPAKMRRLTTPSHVMRLPIRLHNFTLLHIMQSKLPFRGWRDLPCSLFRGQSHLLGLVKGLFLSRKLLLHVRCVLHRVGCRQDSF